MISSFRALALVSTFVLASCGGGGGGGGSTGTGSAPSGPQPVAITETNAKPVAASALDAAQDTSATEGAGVLGVQVDAGGSPPVNFRLIAESVRFAANTFSAAALPVGTTVSQTSNCSLGGTVAISGQVAGTNGMTAGDSLSITFNNCTETAGTTMNGQLTVTLQSGSLTALPFHVVIATTATNLTVTSNGTTAVSNGSFTLDWTASSETIQTITVSGSTMSSRETVSGTTHTTTLRNFSQTVSINGTSVGASLSATVETDSSRLGGTAVTYTVSTPTPVVWNESTGTVTAGVVKVVGANNSQLLVTVNADTSVTLQVDANGDGVFEKTITSTTAELASLR